MEIFSEIFNGFPPSAIIPLIITALLLVGAAFMSAAEVAFFSLSPNDLSELDNENRTDKLILELRANPEKLLATILIANNLFNVGVIILSTFASNKIFDFSDHILLGFVFQSVIIAFLLLFFGEALPKIYSTVFGKKVVYKGARIIRNIQTLLSPFSAILVHSTHIINKKMTKYSHTNISVDELSDALKLTSNEKDDDNEILEGIVRFGNISVSKVMTPRLNMVDVEIKTPFQEALRLIIDSGYSRVPVYQGSEDNIKGILYLKDLLAHVDKNNIFRWQSLVRQAYFVPETKKIDDLLSDFQKNKIHIAVVVDEFGGTSGIVTMEDVLEEILGEIRDEYDDDEIRYQEINKQTYLVEAQIALPDFFRMENVDEDDFADISDDIETLAGLILKMKGEIPVNKEIINYKQYSFEIIKADNRRIEKVKLKINPQL